MKIALLSLAFSKERKESTQITIVDFAKQLKKNKQDVVIITERRPGLKKFEKIDGIPVYRPFKFIKITKYNILNQILAHSLGLRSVEKKLKTRFDIVHSFSASPLLALRSILTLKAKKIHTIKSESRYGLGFARILNFVDKVTVPNKTLADKLVKNGTKKSKITLIKSFIDTSKFKPKNKEALKKKYNLKNKTIILHYGAVWKEKGTDILIKAIPSVVKQNKDAIFIIAPRYKINKKGKFRENKHLRIIDKKINVVDYVNMADIVVLPYLNLIATEGNPSCLLEAIACKTPVITSDLPELKEIVTKNKDVLMAEPGNVESLAENINKLLKNKKLRKTLANHAYKKIKNFDIDKITKQYIQLYKSL